MKQRNRLFVLILVGFMSSSLTHAQTYNGAANGDSSDTDLDYEMLKIERMHRGSKISKKRRRTTRKKKKIGINVFMLYNTVDHISTTANSTGDNSYSNVSTVNNISQTLGEFQSDPSYGIGIEYSKKSLFKAGPVGFGFGVGTTYEFEREIKRKFVNYSYTTPTSYTNTIYGSSNPTMSVILPYLNANVSYKKSYMFGGVNYSVLNSKNMGDENLEGKMGYQVGFGSSVSKWVAVEIVHQWTLFEATPSDVIYYNSVAYGHGDSGLGITSKESMSVQGLTLNLKVLF